MKLRGTYDPKATYEVNDVVVSDGGIAYRLSKPATSGVPPVNTAYWTRLDPVLSECAQMILSCMVTAVHVNEPPAAPAEEEQPKKTRTRKKEATAQ